MDERKRELMIYEQRGMINNRGENSAEGICEGAGMREAGAGPMRVVAEPLSSKSGTSNLESLVNVRRYFAE